MDFYGHGFSRDDFALMEPAVAKLLEQFKTRFGKYPNVVQFDDGGEFYNTKVLPLLQSKNIRYFLTRLTSKKAALDKRFNRTLKTRMWKFFNHEGNKAWIHVLHLLVEGINDSINRTINMKPNEVTSENQHEVFLQLYGHL